MSGPTATDYTNDFMLDETIPESTPMRNYFRGKTILLTGGTGFLGQLYVEKLLRIDVKEIYLLTRSKKGKTPEERLKEIYSGVLFLKLSKADPDYLKRIRVIDGDTSKLQVGISDDDMKDICENVQIVLHAAADVRFDETLRKLILVNLRGTRELLEIAAKIKNLEAFTYVSTAYSNCYRHDIDEIFYKCPVDPDIMIKVVEKYADDESENFEIVQARIINPWPNTYTYTKALCEEIVRRYRDKFPICIIRPTIVIATHEDPIPAWCNNIYGLNGMLVACGIGVLRLMPLNRNIIGDIVCADFVTNSTLAVTWYTHEKYGNGKKELGEDPQIYHVSSYEDNPLTYGVINDTMRDMFAKYPSSSMLWKHCPSSTTCPFMEKLLTIYYHVIPAVVLDTVLGLQKNNQKPKLLPVYRKVQKFTSALKYFMRNEIKFTNSNMKRVLAKMTKYDQEYFPSDIRRLNWQDYSYDYTNGLKVYIGGENVNNLTLAKKKYRRLVIAHYFVLTLYYSFHATLFYYVFRYFGLIDYIQNCAEETYEIFFK